MRDSDSTLWLAKRWPPTRVGDSADDVEGARQVGWTAYRYTGGGFGDLPEALDW